MSGELAKYLPALYGSFPSDPVETKTWPALRDHQVKAIQSVNTCLDTPGRPSGIMMSSTSAGKMALAQCFPATHPLHEAMFITGFGQVHSTKVVRPGHFTGGSAERLSAYEHDFVVKTNRAQVWYVDCKVPGYAGDAIDSDMLRAVLVNVFKTNVYDAPLEVNASHHGNFDLIPITTDTLQTSPKLDEREVAILESRQQRDAILLAKDFRAALHALTDEEQFSNYDLSVAIGVTRAVLVTWRARPLEKLWQANQTRMGRLLLAWKYWLHVTCGEPLGQYLRDVPESCATSLLDLLSTKSPTDEEVAGFIDRLAAYAKEDRRAAAERRRDIGGLPHSAYSRDVAFD